MRFGIRYVSRFAYPSPVELSHNVLRACPASDDHQIVFSYRVTTNPAARVHSYVDYWGTRVDAFGVRTAHEALTVVAEATVETRPPSRMIACPRIERLRDSAFIDEHGEYLGRSPHTAWDERLRQTAARRAESAGDDVVGIVLALMRTVGTSLTYAPGTTYVGVPVREVLERGKGVCQDYAHLLAAMCRSLGIPARYVSGYLFSAEDNSATSAPVAETVRVKTHAWVEVAIPGAGWWGLDPTNQLEVGPRHVKIGHGRDYDDVSPLRGIYQGPADQVLDVSVEMQHQASRPQ
jgi:transglutaminase-like putative cysteine protease